MRLGRVVAAKYGSGPDGPHHGSVVRLYRGGGFRIAWEPEILPDGWGGTRRVPGGRYDYPGSSESLFRMLPEGS